MPNRSVFNDIPQNMQVQVFASDGQDNHAIKVNDEGQLVVTTSTALPVSVDRQFIEERDIYLEANEGDSFRTTAIDVSKYSDYTLFVHKIGGTESVEVKVEVAPVIEPGYWVGAPNTEKTILANKSAAFVPVYYARYVRFYIIGLEVGTSVEILLNAQY